MSMHFAININRSVIRLAHFLTVVTHINCVCVIADTCVSHTEYFIFHLLKLIHWNLQIGFNAGNGTQAYEYKPYSQASVLRDLTGRGWANGFPGRHIFRIDERIMLGTCNKDIGMGYFTVCMAILHYCFPWFFFWICFFSFSTCKRFFDA